MNATEAYAASKKQEYALPYAAISGAISGAINKGLYSAMVRFEVVPSPATRDRLSSTLKSQGYEVKWLDTALRVTWHQQESTDAKPE